MPNLLPSQSALSIIPAPQIQWYQNFPLLLIKLLYQKHRDKPVPLVQPSLHPQQFYSASVPSSGFAVSAATPLSAQPASQLPTSATSAGEKLSPYPLFLPDLIPGMVKKMQIGSEVS